MTSRIWFKLISAFALVIVVGIIVTVILARQGTATQFAHLMVNSQMIQPERIRQLLTDYYRQQASWEGVDEELDRIVGSASTGNMGGMMGSMMGMMNNRLQVVDVSDNVVADTHADVGSPPISSQATQRWPLVVDDQLVGMLLVEGSMMGMSGVDDQALLSGVTRAVLIAGLVAGFVALVIGGLLVRQITQPLAGLIQASGRIAAGDLSVRVPIQSRDELGDLAGTFNQMADSLETQETLRRNLMADIAHELRTPLAGIQGTVEALQDGVFPLTEEGLMPIHDEVTLLNRLVEDLRLLANAEAGNISLNKTLIDLAQLAERQVNTFQYRAAEQGVNLLLVAGEKIPPLYGDEQRLSQVLTNLLSNALRHTLDGGTVCVRVMPARDGVQISVKDTGEGIPAIELPHVFERFYRVDRSRSRKTGGTGLGLAIARQIVEAHGGRIWVESPPAEQSSGSEFSLVLPVDTG